MIMPTMILTSTYQHFRMIRMNMFQYQAPSRPRGLASVPKPPLPNVQIGLPRPKRRKFDRFHYVFDRELRPTQFIPRLQRIFRKLIIIRKVMRSMIKKLTYQSWAGHVPNSYLGGFMTDGSASFNDGWRNRGQGILRLL